MGHPFVFLISHQKGSFNEVWDGVVFQLNHLLLIIFCYQQGRTCNQDVCKTHHGHKTKRKHEKNSWFPTPYESTCLYFFNMGVSKNRGKPPKWMVYNGKTL